MDIRAVDLNLLKAFDALIRERAGLVVHDRRRQIHKLVNACFQCPPS